MEKRVSPSLLLLFVFSFCLFGISFGQKDSKTPGIKADSSFMKRQTGYYNVSTLSLLTFTGQILPGVQTISGYRINRYLSIGGGIGYEWYKSLPTYDIFEADLSLLPVFADVRYTPLAGKITPVIAVNG